MYYCRINEARGGFFDETNGSEIPEGAVEITAEQHAELFAAHALGKLIVPDADGYPIAIDPPVELGDILGLIAAERYQREIAGITINGLLIDTSDRSKTLINGSALKALRNPDYVLRWKTADGFIDLAAEQVLAIADAVSDFVQACFDREETLQKAVADGTYTPAMLDEGWPA